MSDESVPWFEGERHPDFNYHLRRLTPTECERLQGFPDGWTDIPCEVEVIDWARCPDELDDPEGFAAFAAAPPTRKVKASDTARYKALGNSMAVPVMRWIGSRIMKAGEILEED